MARLIYVQTVNRVIQDAATNTFSAIDFVDGFTIPEPGGSSQTFAVIGKYLDVNAGNTVIKIDILDGTNDSVIITSTLSARLNAGSAYFYTNFKDVNFPRAGKYYIRTSINDVPTLDKEEHFFQINVQ